MSRPLDNAAPTIFATTSAHRRNDALWADDYADTAAAAPELARRATSSGSSEPMSEDDKDESDEEPVEPIDAYEVFDLLRSVTDPEHPVSLEQLRVVSAEDIHVAGNRVLVYLTPTIPHCSMSTLIGLSLRVRLLRALPPRYRVDIRIKAGTHQSEHAVNKQLNDKERVQAALENTHLLQVVEGCLATAGRRGVEVADPHAGHGH